MIEIGYYNPKHMYLCSDFNQITQLERCFNLKAIKSAEIILEHIFSLDDKARYHSNIMKVLPRILGQDRISANFLQFFSIPTEGESLCSLEMTIKHPNAPLFSPQQVDFMTVS